MKKILLLALLAFSVSINSSHAEFFNSTGTIDVYFSPRGHCTEAIIKQLDNANTEILIQAYSFTSVSIARAITDAQKRGVHIEIILDKSQRTAKYSGADFVAHAWATYIDVAHAIAHNKIMIIDRKTLITGSFNFTKAAEEKNAENLLIISGNSPLVNRYIQNFELHKNHSERYYGR